MDQLSSNDAWLKQAGDLSQQVDSLKTEKDVLAKEIKDQREDQKQRLSTIKLELSATNAEIRSQLSGNLSPAQEKILTRLQERRNELMQQRHEIRQQVREFGHTFKKVQTKLEAAHLSAEKIKKKILENKIEPKKAKAEIDKITDNFSKKSISLKSEKDRLDDSITNLKKQSGRLVAAGQERIALASSVRKEISDVVEMRKKYPSEVSKYPKVTRVQLYEQLKVLESKKKELEVIEKDLKTKAFDVNFQKAQDAEGKFVEEKGNSLAKINQEITSTQKEITTLLNTQQKTPKSLSERIQGLFGSQSPKKVNQATAQKSVNELNVKMTVYAEGVLNGSAKPQQLNEIKSLAKELARCDLSNITENTKNAVKQALNLQSLLVRGENTPEVNAKEYTAQVKLEIFSAGLVSIARSSMEIADIRKQMKADADAGKVMTEEEKRKRDTGLQRKVNQLHNDINNAQEALDTLAGLTQSLDDSSEVKNNVLAEKEYFDKIGGGDLEACRAYESKSKPLSDVFQGLVSSYIKSFGDNDFRKRAASDIDALLIAHRNLIVRDPENKAAYEELINVFTELNAALVEASTVFRDQYTSVEHGVYEIKGDAKRTDEINQAKAKLETLLEELGERIDNVKFVANSQNTFSNNVLGAVSRQTLQDALAKIGRDLAKWDSIS